MHEGKLNREDMSPDELHKHSKEFNVSRVDKSDPLADVARKMGYNQRPNISDCEELKAKPDDPRSIGERRLKINIIDCSNTFAAYTCHMIDDLERMRNKTRNQEAGRLISETQTQLQQAYLWYKEVLATL